jgi:hypothetical protein
MIRVKGSLSRAKRAGRPAGCTTRSHLGQQISYSFDKERLFVGFVNHPLKFLIDSREFQKTDTRKNRLTTVMKVVAEMKISVFWGDHFATLRWLLAATGDYSWVM